MRKLIKPAVYLLLIVFLLSSLSFTAEYNTISTDINGAKIILKNLENSLKINSLSNEWKEARKIWIKKLDEITNVAELRQLVYQLELNLVYNAQSSDWRSHIRNEWLAKIKSAAELKEIVKLIVMLESSINWDAQQSGWRTERIQWIGAANKISGMTEISAKLQDQDQNLVTNIRALGKLVLEFEKKVQYSAQDQGWRQKRQNWTQGLNTVSNVQDLAKLVMVLYENFKPEAMAKVWLEKHKDKWIQSIKNVQNIKTLASLILEMERALKWSAHYNTWWNARESWVGQVNRYSGDREIAVKYDTSQAQANTGLLRAAGFLIALENGIERTHFINTWANKRSAWIDKLMNSTKVSEVSASMLTFIKYLNKNIYHAKWKENYPQWLKSLNAAKNLNELVKVISDFEISIINSAHTSDWDNLRKTWYKTMYSAVGLNQEAPNKLEGAVASSQSLTEPTAGAPRVPEKTLKKLVDLILQFERDIVYTSKDQYWRISWMKQLAGATEVKRLGFLVFRLESKIPYRSQSSNWREARKTWKDVIQAVTTVPDLVKGIITFERSLLWEAHTKYWRQKRRSWMGQLNATAGLPVAMIPAKYTAAGEVGRMDVHLQALAEIVLDLENELKYSAYKVNWNNNRIKWIRDVVRSGSFEQLGKRLAGLENLIKATQMSAKWKESRTEWIKNIQKVQDKAILAQLIIELERNILWSAHSDGWQNSRLIWYAKLNKFVSSTFTPDKEIEPNAGRLQQVRKLTVLLLDLERGIKKNAFTERWKTERSKWLMQIFNARTVQYLSSQVSELVSMLQRNSLSRRWDNVKEKWLSDLYSATNAARVAELLTTLERSLRWNSQNAQWRGQRAKWFNEIKNLSGKTSVRNKI